MIGNVVDGGEGVMNKSPYMSVNACTVGISSDDRVQPTSPFLVYRVTTKIYAYALYIREAHSS